MDKTVLILAIIGALNWGCIGLFRFDFISWLFNGQTSTVSRIIFTIVGIAGIWCFKFLFSEREHGHETENRG